MTPNANAQKVHDELFAGHVSTLAVTDPELIDLFDNFAFDEVLRQGNLDQRVRLIVQLAAIIASQALREYRVMLGAALTAGVTPVEAKEILYQAVAYVDRRVTVRATVWSGMVALRVGARCKARRAPHKIDRGPHEAVVRLVSNELRRQYSSQ